MSEQNAAAQPEACQRWNVPQLEDANTARHGDAGRGSKAWAAGFEEGRLEGIDAGREQLRAQVHQFHALVQTLATPFAELDAQVEQQLVQLAIAIAQQLIRHELAADPGLVLGAVRQAMAVLPAAARRIRVHLHPEDAQVVRAHMPEFNAESCEIIADLQLERGGCRVTTDTSHVDATVQTRVSQIVAAMLGEPGAET